MTISQQPTCDKSSIELVDSSKPPQLDPLQKVHMQDFKQLLSVSFPSVCYIFLTMLLNSVDAIMVGRAYGNQLSAVTIGSSITYLTLFIPVSSTVALDALNTQAIGAGSPKKVGIYTQIGTLVALILSIIPIFIWFFSKHVLSLLRFSDYLVQNSSEYMSIQTFSILFFVLFTLFGPKTLECQGIILPQVVIMVITNIFNIITNYIFIFRLDMGLRGAGLSTALSRVWPFCFLLIYHKYTTHFNNIWTPFDKKYFKWKEIRMYLQISLPGMTFQVLDNAAFTLWAIFAGYLGTLEASAHSVLFSTISLSYSICVGLGIASSIRVGRLVGAGEAKRAKMTGYMSVGLSLAVMSFSSVVLISFRHYVPTWFTSDEAIIEVAIPLFFPAAFFQLSDGVQTVSAGIIRGLGKNKAAAVIVLFTYYGISMPLTYLLAFRLEMSIFGMWVAIAIALSCAAICLFCLVLFTNWQKEADRSRERLCEVEV
ncbi:hypothetical protein P9112_000461 [Eukaryota sp. TZLM1-RC]